MPDGNGEVSVEEAAAIARAAPATDAVLACQNLSHSYGPVEVLSNISLNFRAGEIHAIIGENGAGKSTLMKILSGHLAPTKGKLAMDGQPVRFTSPVAAEKGGVVLVHQEVLLAPHLTVAENIFLGRELRRGWLVDDRAMNRRSVEVLASLGVDIPPGALVESLSIARRQLVQIARALLEAHRVVIFDEPTASLTPVETDALLKLIFAIKVKGVAVLYISHRLPEVKAIADRVTVLRDGKWIDTRPASQLQPLDMARLMVGREMSQLYPVRTTPPPTKPVLEVSHFSVPGYAADASFAVSRGEILGFGGLVGAGRTELFEGICGLRSGTGAVRINGEPIATGTPRATMDAGMVYLSEDRKGRGLLLDKPLATNLTLAALERFRFGPFVNRLLEWQALGQAIKDFDIRTGARVQLAGQLSGGNQQKLLLAKMMQVQPGIIIIDEPTRGVDVGAKQQIYQFIAALAASGKAVVVISSEIPELIGLCHRVLVMRSGRIAGEVLGDAMREDEIVAYATGALGTQQAMAARA